MNRRQALTRLAAALAVVTVAPMAAEAMGGQLPELDQPAPDFDLLGMAPGAAGEVLATRLTLADRLGRWTVLYFYPRDFTSGCTLEARGFQRDLEAFHVLGAEVIGVSADSSESHSEFCGSEGLRYPLLSDGDGVVSRRYGSWIAPFSQRHTFLIDPEGRLRARWVDVRPAGHSREVLAVLSDFKGVARSESAA